MNKKCGICKGPCVYLGLLGGMRCYRCQNCGMISQVRVKAK